MVPPLWRSSVLLMLCLTALSAAEVVVRDVRVAALIRPTAFDFEVVSATFTGAGDDAFDSGTGFEIGGRYSLARTGSQFGLVLGGDLSYDTFTYDGDGEMTGIGLRGAVGLAWALADRVTILAEGGAGYGIIDLELPASAANTTLSVDGGGLILDARISTMYRISRRWALHAHIGYLLGSYDLSGDAVDVTMDQAGIYAGIGVTWLFSTKPTRLE